MLNKLLGIKDIYLSDEKLLEGAREIKSVEQANHLLLLFDINNLVELMQDLYLIILIGIIIFIFVFFLIKVKNIIGNKSSFYKDLIKSI